MIVEWHFVALLCDMTNDVGMRSMSRGLCCCEG